MNNSIRKLDKNVYSLIAAGEVIERPASMLKELIDNAIDSKANKIEIAAEEAGLKSLIVQDNGLGISYKELPLAIEHHATSKIETVDDISNINTLGFRGEALASIAQVTELEIISKKEDESGGVISVQGGESIEHKPSPSINGTKVVAKNLFFNVPARLKFLKHKSREFYLLKEVFDAESLSHNNIEFRLKHNGKDVGFYRKTESIKERVFEYLKNDVKEADFFEGYIEKDSFKVYAIFSNQKIYQSFRKHSYIFLNTRPIDNKSISFAVKNAYTGAIPREYFPYYFIYITIDPKTVDVNVHPSKKEVRIKNEREISSAIYEMINKKLVETIGIVSSNIDNDYERFTEARRDKDFFSSGNIENTFPVINKEFIENTFERQNTYNSEDSYTNNQANSHTANSFLNYTIPIGQIFSSYILAQSNDSILIIDQHAAYERLNYERIYQSLTSQKLEHEKLLIPLEFEYKDFEIEILNECKEMLKSIGIYFEASSKNSVIIEKLPLYIPKTEKLSALLKDILDSFIENSDNNTLEKVIKNTCNMIACKYSPKAGDRLSISDMQNLLDTLQKENILFSCPHGRPFVLKMSKEYLDKKFFRIN